MKESIQRPKLLLMFVVFKAKRLFLITTKIVVCYTRLTCSLMNQINTTKKYQLQPFYSVVTM